MPYYDLVEYDDVLDGENDEDMFPNHGKVICVKKLHDHCMCLRCKPRERRYWRISRCKYGPQPWVKQDKQPEGCVWLHFPNDYYCKPYCKFFDGRIKAQAFKEVFGFRGRLAKTKSDNCFKSIEGILAQVDEIFDNQLSLKK